MKCDKKRDCVDATDEEGCMCGGDEFRCKCYNNIPVSCPESNICIPKTRLRDCVDDCTDRSDEVPRIDTVPCGDCSVRVQRYSWKKDTFRLSCSGQNCYSTAKNFVRTLQKTFARACLIVKKDLKNVSLVFNAKMDICC